MDEKSFWAKYGKDHIIIYSGYTNQVRSNPKPLPPGEYLLNLKESSVYIDGMNFGPVQRPVSTFDVGPGLHKLEVVGKFYREVSSTDVRPARVRDDSSLLISLRAVECLTGVYWEIKEFTNLKDFLKHTGVSLA